MNIIIVSHERSLNKAEGLLNLYKDHSVSLIVDILPEEDRKPYVRLAKRIVMVKNFDVVEIVKKIKHCDKVYCVSENLLPIQSQLESYYGIQNITPYAAEVLSNKQKFDNFCRDVGLGDYVPLSVTPTFYNQLNVFKNKEIFTKPDIGTGSNVFYPGDDQSSPSIEYRRWNNKHHFLKHLKDKNIHNSFFDLNRQGIYSERFNFKSCRIMVQEYFWSTEPSICPIGYVNNGKVKIGFFVKNSKIKYGDLLDPFSNPIESHSVSKVSDIVRERAVWIVSANEIPESIVSSAQHFLQTVVDKLKIKELFFAGPDFHVANDKLIAIDFNPRPGQFINILDKLNDHTVMDSLVNNAEINIKQSVLWGCAVLTPGKIKELKDLSVVSKFFNAQNTDLEVGMNIPAFQNLQNKSFNINLDITGSNEKELFDNYTKINQLLQSCIIYN